MPFLFAGYFPKKIVKRDAWLKAPQISEIWSVSECMSKGPGDWINKWLHNDLWLFDTVALAEAVIPPEDRAETRVLAYRIWDRMFDAGQDVEAPLVVKDLPGPEEHFLDVARAEGAWKIVECNCFNGSRFYSADVERLVAAVSEHQERRA